MSTALYEPLIERDLDRVPEAVRAFRDEHTSEELWQAVTRFAILAYAPSQHAKHAVLACLAAWELRERIALDDWMIACARYAAASRQPWSEPPLMDPPEASSDRSIDELRAAVADGDRLRAERWLAARLDDESLIDDLFLVATDDFEDLGHKLIIAVAASKLAALLGAKGRFVTLRIATTELTAYRGPRYVERGAPAAAARVIDALDGSIERAHHLYLLDAARGTKVEPRVRDYLGSVAFKKATIPATATTLEPYDLARDCAGYLKSHAIAQRFPAIGAERIIAAARHNLDHGSSFEDFAFA